MDILTLVEDAGPILTAIEAVEDNASTIAAKAEALLATIGQIEQGAITDASGIVSAVKGDLTDFVTSVKDGFASVTSLFTTVKTAVTTTPATTVAAAPGAGAAA